MREEIWLFPSQVVPAALGPTLSAVAAPLLILLLVAVVSLTVDPLKAAASGSDACTQILAVPEVISLFDLANLLGVDCSALPN